jgi:integrase
LAKASRRYLVLKGNTWWFKRDIPVAIRPAIGRGTAYQVNLGTGDIRVAAERRDGLQRETDQLYSDARAGRPLTAARDRLRESAEAWAAELASYSSDPVAWYAAATGQQPQDADPAHAFGPHEMIEAEVDRLRRAHGEGAATRFSRIASGRPSVDHYLDGYLTEAGLAAKTTNERRGCVGRFARWAETEGLTVADISRGVAGRYVSEEIAGRDRSTANKHLGALKLYWDHLVNRGAVTGDNPWKGQRSGSRARGVSRDRPPDERPFTAPEMRALLYSPYPRGMRSEFEPQLRDMMRIAALSGMRLAEIATLQVSECVMAGDGGGLSHFNITHGKTRAALRKVPIHSDLAPIVEARLKAKGANDWLFHELAGANNAGDVFGKRFAAYRKKVGVGEKVDGKRRSLVNFHSFRRWFITEAERAGQMGHIISAVAGHEDGRQSMALGTYSGGPSEAQLRACVEAAKLPRPLPQ